ncbi:hypothetical protein PAL_GLEAN10000168 [Pteropus alecto]|uniref:Uncharacterized protein n=1 Tax=Pteropus alecto TaxID=9402 RepID=L5KAD4_PTEAL|nr:hypothetical protein PAL_GLEAN10000168 [Pteropus alecto]
MGRVSSQSLTCPFVGRIWHSEIAIEVKKESLEPNPSSVVAKTEPRKESGGQTSQDSKLELNLEVQSSRAKEARKAVRAKEAPALSVTLEPCVRSHEGSRAKEAPGLGVTLEPCVTLRRSESSESSKKR